VHRLYGPERADKPEVVSSHPSNLRMMKWGPLSMTYESDQKDGTSYIRNAARKVLSLVRKSEPREGRTCNNFKKCHYSKPSSVLVDA